MDSAREELRFVEGERSLEEWLREREPGVPSPFLPYLLDGAPGATPDAKGLAEAGIQSLLRALARPGRVRDAAFLLLAGDGLLTYACEVTADAPDPGPRLAELVEEVGSRLS